MSNQLQLTGGMKVRNLDGVLTASTGIVNSVGFGQPNGVATLDSAGKVPVSQLPNSVMEFKGTWNAATNTPTLANGTGNAGDVYLCNVAGTVNFGAGPIPFAVGDYVVYSGSTWERSSGATGTVTSVGASITGNSISLTGSPITTAGTLAFAFSGISGQYINGAGNLVTFPTIISSIGLSMPSAFSVSNSPLTANGTIAVTGAGTVAQYIRGDGSLATFPSTGGGGSSVYYYLNGSINASVTGYKQMANTAVIGVGTDFSLVGNGLIAEFLTDAGNPNRLLIPSGSWNFEMYFSMSSSGGNQKFYVELLKYDGSTFTSIASTSTNPEEITGGTTTDLYVTSMAVPETTLLTTDRLALRIYIVDNSVGRTSTLHTEDNNLCQITTTFAAGVSSLNGLTANTQYFAVGTAGSDFNISSVIDTHTFNLPTASATKRGALSSADWSTFNGKQSVITLTTTGSSGASTFISNILNVPTYTLAGLGGQPLSTNLTSLAGLTYGSTSFVKMTAAGTFTLDTNTYALSSALSGYLPLTGGTLTGPLNGTIGTFTSAPPSNGGILETFNSSATVSNTTFGGVAFTSNPGSDFAIGKKNVNNTATFEIQRISSPNVTLFKIDTTGAGTFTSSVTATSIIKTSGTSTQFLKADGSVDSSTYLTTSSASSTYLTIANAATTYLALTGGILTGNLTVGTTTNYSKLTVTQTSSYSAFNITDGLNGQLNIYSYTNSTYGVILKSSNIADDTFLPMSLQASRVNINNGSLVIGGTNDYGYAFYTTGSVEITGGFGYGSGFALYPRGQAVSDWYLGKYGSGTPATINNSIGSVTTNVWQIGYDSTGTFVPTIKLYSGGAATFSSSVTATASSGGGALYLRGNSASNLSQFYFFDNTETTLYHYLEGNPNELQIRAQGSRAIRFYTNGVERLTLASTGAATFSSTVQVPSGASGGLYKMAYGGSTSSRSWQIASDAYNYGDFGIQVSNSQTGTTYTNALLISNAGNVGIGTTSPSDKLSVGSSTGSSISITTNQAAGSSGTPYNTDLNFRGYADRINARIRSWDESASTGYGYLTFWTNNGSSETERMRITGTGNVGIGTTSPYSSGVLTLQESSSLSAALSMKNRNSTMQWDLAVDAAAVDDKTLAFIDRGASIVRMSLKSTGILNIANVPTSTSGLVTGDIYKTVAGVLMIVL